MISAPGPIAETITVKTKYYNMYNNILVVLKLCFAVLLPPTEKLTHTCEVIISNVNISSDC